MTLGYRSPLARRRELIDNRRLKARPIASRGAACQFRTAALPLRAAAAAKEPAMPECFVAKASDLKDGDRRIVIAGAQEIGVFYKDGAYYAYSNTCVHQGGPACEGIMINRVVDVIGADRTYQGQVFGDEVHFVCPWHGYEYELKTGECVGDRRLRLKKYQVIQRGGDIFVVA
jgi:nitrite reductase/ring-hydroxylating ferredoxin subunit